jgi:hypothetical protein
VTAPPRNRTALERASARPLIYLHLLPRWLPPVALAALLIGGLVAKGLVSAVLLLVVAAFLGWLAALSWPRLDSAGRLLRAAAVAIVVVYALTRIR